MYLDLIIDRFLSFAENACDQSIMHTSNTLFSTHLIQELVDRDLSKGTGFSRALFDKQSTKSWHKVSPTHGT